MVKIEEINEEEIAYGWEESSYPLRKQCGEKLSPFKKLFDAGQEFMDKHNLWMHSQVGTYEPEEIDQTIGNLYRAVVKLEKQFSDSMNTQRLATGIKNSIDEFKTHLPLINTLGNPGMRDRHWEQVSEIIGFPIKKSADMTLEKVIDYGLAEYVSKFEPISESATKENNLDKSELKIFTL
jgi:dynein heavy chain